MSTLSKYHATFEINVLFPQEWGSNQVVAGTGGWLSQVYSLYLFFAFISVLFLLSASSLTLQLTVFSQAFHCLQYNSLFFDVFQLGFNINDLYSIPNYLRVYHGKSKVTVALDSQL